MTVYYLAGPMASYPDHNHPAFHEATAALRARGYTIINPAEYGNLVTGRQECMKRDIHALLWCDAVIVLPGWERSRGTTLETNAATDLDMPVYELSAMLNGISAPVPLQRIKQAYYTMHVASYTEIGIEAIFQ